QVLLNFADSLLEYIYYYSQFEGRWEDMVADDFEDKLANLQELYRLAVAYNRDEIADYLYNSLM
ncbi:MAG: hypothetical protein IKB37_02460, partial [Rikenellaceae bacterium]|nr:hypothetical protein [Rikenellaceae bacterium]